MVNTLAGSYKTSVMVVMHNLRLPELDKNHKKYAQCWRGLSDAYMIQEENSQELNFENY